MAAVAHNPAFAKKVGISQSVGKDFNDADKGKTFKQGGTMATKKKMDPKMMSALMAARQPKLPAADAAAPAPMGAAGMMRKGGVAKKMASGGMAKDDTKQDKKLIKKAFSMHDKQEHKGEKTDLSKLKKGGMAAKKMAKGGMAKESMGPKTMSKDVEKGSNKLTKFGESAVQKRGHTRGMEPKMKGKTV